MRDRPTQPSATPTITRLRRSSDAHGSALASRVATAARKYTTAVGTTTAAHTHTRSCVAASTGMSRKPVVNTSDVQLCGVATPVSRVSTPSTTTSTSSASHAIRTADGCPCRVHSATASAHSA